MRGAFDLPKTIYNKLNTILTQLSTSKADKNLGNVANGDFLNKMKANWTRLDEVGHCLTLAKIPEGSWTAEFPYKGDGTYIVTIRATYSSNKDIYITSFNNVSLSLSATYGSCYAFLFTIFNGYFVYSRIDGQYNLVANKKPFNNTGKFTLKGTTEGNDAYLDVVKIS